MGHHRSRPLLAVSFLSSFAAATIGFDCTDIVAQKQRFNLGELGGPRVVHWLQEGEPTSSDYTFSLDICRPLKKHQGQDPHDECPRNTRGMHVPLQFSMSSFLRDEC